MELKDYAQFVAIFVTLAIGLFNLLLSISMSKKLRHTNVATMRRKERIDSFIVYYGKMSALVHPDTVKAYACRDDCTFFERLIESFSNLNMLLDHRYEKDAQLASVLRKLTRRAVEYYYVCNLSEFSEQVTLEYEEKYLSDIMRVDQLLNLFIGVEWTRLKQEALTGAPVSAKEWFKLYDEAERYYKQWHDIYK